MDLLDIFGVHTVTVTPLEGVGAKGEVFGTPFDITDCFVTERNILVRNSKGAVVTSSAQIAIRADKSVPAGSKIRLPGGRGSKAISVSRADHIEALPLPNHQVINCE